MRPEPESGRPHRLTQQNKGPVISPPKDDEAQSTANRGAGGLRTFANGFCQGLSKAGRRNTQRGLL